MAAQAYQGNLFEDFGQHLFDPRAGTFRTMIG
jgi:hypothetical protein